MRINPLNWMSSTLNQVQEGQSGTGKHPSHQEQPPKKEEKSKKEPSFEVSLEKLTAAVESFQADLQTQTSGLQVTREGQGPGLRVVLKDATGSLLRQFTGEEFLKLRETTINDFYGRGKILDQKL